MRGGCCRHATHQASAPRAALYLVLPLLPPHIRSHLPDSSASLARRNTVQGDSGIGWAFLPKLLAEDLPHTQWVLPNAPVVRPLWVVSCACL